LGVTLLKIKGTVSDDGHAYINAFMYSPKIGSTVPIVFLVDLGATTTTILEGDCERTGIDCSKLQRSPDSTVVAGGKIQTYILPDVTLFFESQDGTHHVERLPRVDVIKPRKGSIKLPFSLLGIDVVRTFKLTYSSNELTLAK
jgi:hypothetical protein